MRSSYDRGVVSVFNGLTFLIITPGPSKLEKVVDPLIGVHYLNLRQVSLGSGPRGPL